MRKTAENYPYDYGRENRRLMVAVKHMSAAEGIIKEFDVRWDFYALIEKMKILLLKLFFRKQYQLMLYVLKEGIKWEIEKNRKTIEWRIERRRKGYGV